MSEVTLIGIDLAKRVFQLHCARSGAPTIWFDPEMFWDRYARFYGAELGQREEYVAPLYQ